MHTVGNSLLWSSFVIIVIIMFSLDLIIQYHTSNDKPASIKHIALWSLLWIVIAMIFNIMFWTYLVNVESIVIANSKSLAFFNGYLLEKTLATDNVIIWLTLFRYFSIPLPLQRRILTWGILGAIGLRTIMVFTGSWLINKFHGVFYIFGVFLLFTGIRMIIPYNNKQNISKHILIRWFYHHLRITNKLHGERFFIRRNRTIIITPLLLTLIMVEFSDIIFSLDSIPAIFSITTDPFIILTSNLFAILGLRAMYFLLAKLIELFSLLKYGLAIILIFISIKMLIVDYIHISVVLSLFFIISSIIVTLLLNTWINHRQQSFNKKM